MPNVVSFRGSLADAVAAVERAGMSWNLFPLFVEASIDKGEAPDAAARAWGIPVWVYEMVAERLKRRTQAPASKYGQYRVSPSFMEPDMRPRISKEKRLAILEDYEAEIPYAEIVAKHRTSYSTIIRVAREAGCELRTRAWSTRRRLCARGGKS